MKAGLKLAMLSALTGVTLPEMFHTPTTSWTHSDERVRKAEEKRQRKNAKRAAAAIGKQMKERQNAE